MIPMSECYNLREGDILISDATGCELELKSVGILMYTKNSQKRKGVVGKWLDGPDVGLGKKYTFTDLRFFSRKSEKKPSNT